MSFKLFDHDRGAIVAPAGCGKTQAIVDAVARHEGAAVLVLTHTNAGVGALRTRLARAKAPTGSFRLGTIDGWALRLASAFPQLSGHVPSTTARVDYPGIERAALRAVASGALDGPLRATYGRLIVDEYQDCSRDQHGIVVALAERLKTYVFGDPLQRIFDFRPALHPDWDRDVEGQFERIAEFNVPWRWENAGQRLFGDWVLSMRRALLDGQPIDLRTGPPNVAWIALPSDPGEAQVAQAAGVRAVRAAAGQGLLIIGNSRDRQSRSEFARKVPGLHVVEPVDLTDLIDSAVDIEASHGLDRLRATLDFAHRVMTDVDISGLVKRLQSLHTGLARNPADAVEAACLRFATDDGFDTVRTVLKAMGASSRRTFRRDLLSGMIDALGSAHRRPGSSLVDAGIAVREQRRNAGRNLPSRGVGSTLLLKGLEAEHAVVLNADEMNARHFYVAISRASHSLTIFSKSPVLSLR